MLQTISTSDLPAALTVSIKCSNYNQTCTPYSSSLTSVTNLEDTPDNPASYKLTNWTCFDICSVAGPHLDRAMTACNEFCISSIATSRLDNEDGPHHVVNGF